MALPAVSSIGTRSEDLGKFHIGTRSEDDLMGVDLETVAGRGRDSVTAASRRTIATLGIERWRQRAKELARALNKHPDVVSNWASNGGVLRQADLRFSEVIDDLDKRLSVILTEGKEV